jgi:PAS domain S-box-containing protein
VALVIAATVAGIVGARLLGQRDARRESEQRAEVAAAQVGARVQQAASLLDGLRRYMVGVAGPGVTSRDFTGNTSRWLNPPGFPAAAWVEKVPAAQRADYERRIGGPIVAQDRSGGVVPAASRPTMLPATFVSGIPPMSVPGIDLSGEKGVSAALARASTLYDAGATPIATRSDGTRGLFLIRLAPRLHRGVVEPGFVVMFISELWLRAAASEAAALKLTTDGDSTSGDTVRSSFTEAGQRFGVAVPLESVHGAAAVLQWIILGAGILLAALAGALGVNAARRARAQDELDRIFTLTPDVIAVADFDGHFTRVNPAAAQILGYTEEELLARPYVELVHPDDRAQTQDEASAISEGKRTLSFENRFRSKDGSYRVLDWTATPLVDENVMYGVARDVTERRRAEAELERLAGEQAALRRVATLVARGVPPAEVFAAVAEEVERLLGAQATTIARLEPDGAMAIVATSGTARAELPVGSRLELDSDMAISRVLRTGRSVRVDDYSTSSEAVSELMERLGVRCSVAVPIVVEGALWGSISAGTEREQFPEDAERRMTAFTELAGTAIANAESRSELTASRARVVAASDETRRQIERDLHDGAQQRLVHTVMTLKLAQRALPEDQQAGRALLDEALDHAEGARVELRELVRGILPPVLTRSGLHDAVHELAERMPLPVDVAVATGRFPAAVEATAYFVVAESLTNVVKHAQARRASVAVHVVEGALRVEVRDDGVGGARRDGGGYVGLGDRLAVLEGRLEVESPRGGGTVVTATIPLRG